MSRSVRLLARAKLNLTLEVLGKRSDGYHELRSVFALIDDLADDVRVAGSRELRVVIHPDVGAVPGDDLCSRAVRILAALHGREPRASVRVRKRIPVAAGLGGGSSDAAAAVRGLSELWGVGVSEAVAEGLGSDVPFFASGHSLASIEGRGELVRALPPRELWVALVRPKVRLATKEVFGALSPEEWSDGSASARVASALADDADPDALRGLLRNDLLAAASRVCPQITSDITAARAAGIALSLSGSGPSLFALADDRAHAIRLARRLRRASLAARPHRIGIVT
ncbi:MAG: 4-(cytidine 5'-diphospho)-2-C-methyl-D-erythritol kinase [Chloroflexi bacterium]|nr:4-(cytidine 5'-diphospho)-2-C-methyl-D-erythritol kinase [Chloroflexota bacterium]